MARAMANEAGRVKAAARLGVDAATLTRVLDGKPVRHDTIRKLGRIAPRVRKADEFRDAAKAAVAPPVQHNGPASWDLETIRAARDAQMTGTFATPVQLAESIRTDDALFAAYHNRVAPQSAIASELVAAPTARGADTKARAASSVFIPRTVLEGIVGTLANHGVAIGYIEHEPNDAGTQVDFRLTEWPLEFVSWDASLRTLVTTVDGGGARVPITHGNGRWVVFRKFYNRPWVQEACVLPAGFLWFAHANGLADWSASSQAHGLAKIVGELPEGFAMTTDGTTLTDTAQSMLDMAQAIAAGTSAAGLRPFGSKMDFLTNNSTAWQVFKELILNREKAAMRIYNGTDAALGSVGGAPGVDIATLFGVATTRVQGDLEALEAGVNTGVYQPWAAINRGTSLYAPSLRYQMPDPDEDAKRAERAANRKRLHDTIERMKEQGFVVDQKTVDALAAEFGVSPAPVLSAQPSAPAPAA